MNKWKKLTILVLMSMILLSCAKKSDTATVTSSSTSSVNAINAVYENLKENAPSLGESAGILLSTRSLTGLWDNASDTFMGIGSVDTNPQGFVRDLLDPSADQSLFERAKMPFLMACTLDTLGDKTSELLSEGNQTVTFNSSVIGVCGTADDFTGMSGVAVSFTVENLTDDSNYDQKITMSDVFGVDQWIYLRNTDDTLNLMHIESNTAGDEVSVMTLAYDKSTEVGAFQYFAKFPTDEKIFRIYMDTANDDIRLIAYKTNLTKSATVSLASHIDDQASMAMSLSWDNQTAPYDTNEVDENACITTTDASILEDDSSVCTDSDITVLDSSTASSLISELSGFDESTVRTDAANGETLASKLPVFTAATILSASLGF